MPRKPRTEIAGYYHIINRGVDQRIIFKEAKDYEQLEELMCSYYKNRKHSEFAKLVEIYL